LRKCRKKQLNRIPEEWQEQEEIFDNGAGESLGIFQGEGESAIL